MYELVNLQVSVLCKYPRAFWARDPGRSSHPCTLCTAVFSNYDDLRSHIIVHIDDDSEEDDNDSEEDDVEIADKTEQKYGDDDQIETRNRNKNTDTDSHLALEGRPDGVLIQSNDMIES